MDFLNAVDDNGRVVSRPTTSSFATKPNMIKKPATAAVPESPAAIETDTQRFDRILGRVEFKTLKAVLDNLGKDSTVMKTALITTNSYPMFLGKLGYRLDVVKQIHEQDCYSRLGPAGGIRAVLPVHDLATYSTLVTLVNFNATVTTTTKSVDYYDNQLTAFKIQLMNKSGNAA